MAVQSPRYTHIHRFKILYTKNNPSKSFFNEFSALETIRIRNPSIPQGSGMRLERRHRVSRFLLRSRWVFRAAAGTADRRERTVIPEHFSPYKYTPYNIVIQIPAACIRSLGLLVTPPLWDIAGAEHRSRWEHTRKRRDTLDNGVIGPRPHPGLEHSPSEISADKRSPFFLLPIYIFLLVAQNVCAVKGVAKRFVSRFLILLIITRLHYCRGYFKTIDPNFFIYPYFV